MGKLAATLGIGVKGSVAIRLEGTVYRPGETLIGQVTLRIDEAFDGKAFEMTIAGEETLKWGTRRSSSHTLDQNQTVYDHHERRRHLLYHQLVFATPQRYAPGDYVYPFEVALPCGLPSTVDYRASRVSDMQDIHGSVFYYATASLPVDGTFKADLSSYHSFEIASAPQRLPQSLQASATEEVCLLGLVKQGQCKLTATLVSDALQTGEAAEIQCSIQNESRMRAQRVSTYLVQDIELLPSEGWAWSRVKSSTVSVAEYQGLEAGQTKDILIRPPMLAISYFSGSALLLPSFQGQFLRISYRLEIKCKYTLCTGTSIEFPLTIVPAGA
ncbi:hypothetical protein Poli38472_014628 [Pythium oligandrum]|uniref:Arrestin C-terminal-like domain-containing protein n=1 Tax=Pythium oligandrum TaxID=41045 RepID=A0A8K1CK92_PYTOL|nr:hypothetical protein Poli38472_014628 [Pythium oligandrum]|eukprot:TMW63923.1 hypothetical protein Poli38472_014628 [Pythium oligandrum]